MRAGAFPPSRRPIRGMTTNNDSILDHVRVASPCNARWEDMTGDDRARFCKHCSKHVFNLSAMSRVEAETLVREKEGKFCGRFSRRQDGTMLTADCPVGRGVRRRRFVRLFAVAFAAVMLLSSALAASAGRRRDGSRSPAMVKIDGWIYGAKVKLGIVKPPMLMGVVCVPVPPANPAPANPNPVQPAVLGDIAIPVPPSNQK